MSDYQVKLENIFSGPLDLLLYLVRKDEVDIYDISISRITQQYIKYVEMLKSFDLDLAGDFIVMAATLMEIKSAMLLPKADPDEDMEEDDGDPRSQLIRQLLEYKRFKDAASILDLKAGQQQHRYRRPETYIKRIQPDQEPELDLEEISIWTLLETFDHLMKATGRYQDYSQIKDDTPIDIYEIEILDRLQQEGPLTFEHIFEGRTNRLVLVGLFLAMLELIRDRLIWAEQSEETKTIYLRSLTKEPAELAVQNAIITSEENMKNIKLPSEDNEFETSGDNYNNDSDFDYDDSQQEYNEEDLSYDDDYDDKDYNSYDDSDEDDSDYTDEYIDDGYDNFDQDDYMNSSEDDDYNSKE
ncbi:MAG: segregation and condensation protein A [Sedimentisphaeraceae bacterium JB056]